MRLAGYVHRDISGGNCMWYRTGGRGKISDLEFAKPYTQMACHDPRTVCLSLIVEYHMLTPFFHIGYAAVHGS